MPQSNEPLTRKQELMLDGFRRLEQHSPVMMLPRLVMTQHLQQMLRAARARLADSHRYQQHLLGEKPMGDDAGGINVTGDTYHIQTTAGGWLRKLWPLAACAAMGGSAALVGPAIAEWLRPAAAGVAPALPAWQGVSDRAPDWRLGLEVRDRP